MHQAGLAGFRYANHPPSQLTLTVPGVIHKGGKGIFVAPPKAGKSLPAGGDLVG